jgi:hypothetical protein
MECALSQEEGNVTVETNSIAVKASAAVLILKWIGMIQPTSQIY